MNFDLSKEIIKHILSNFGIIDSNFVDKSKTNSLFSKSFLTDRKASINLDDKDIVGNIYGVNINVLSSDLKIYGTKFLIDDFEQYLVVILNEKNIGYGLCLSSDDVNIIGTYFNSWGMTDVISQANLLILTEEVRNFGYSYKKIEIDDHLDEILNEFIRYTSEFDGESNEG